MADIAASLLESIQTRMLDEAFQMSGQVMTVVQPIVQALLVAYVLLWGATVASGRSQEPFGDGIRRILRISFIVLLGFTANGYNSYVCEVMFNLPSTVAAGIAQAGGGDAMTIADVLDESLDAGMSIALDFIRDVSFWKMADSIRNVAVGATVALLTIVLVGIGIAFVYISYVAMGILLAIGPFFIMLLIFDQTRRYFDGWLGQMVTFGVLFLLVAVTTMICFRLLIDLSASSEHTVEGALKLMVAFLCMIAVMVQTRSIAAGIGGGVALQTQSAVGGIYRSMAGGARGAIGGVAGMAARGAAGVGRLAGGSSSANRAASPAPNRVRQTFKN